ncbi:MAG: nucleotidyltransferase domain-containing protein [Cyanobacteriota bacterium]
MPWRHDPRPRPAPLLEAITAACRKHHVAYLHAFGSVLRPDYRPGDSDKDLLVDLLSMDASKLYRAYFDLLNDLRQGLAARVDLVMADAVRNPIGRLPGVNYLGGSGAVDLMTPVPPARMPKWIGEQKSHGTTGPAHTVE